jgi:hypothetical protein
MILAHGLVTAPAAGLPVRHLSPLIPGGPWRELLPRALAAQS